MAEIFAFREDKLGFRYQLGSRSVLGRSPECDLIILDRSASRQHAEIFRVEDKYFIADLGSTNGTLVNDRPVMAQTRLEPYDTIKIGQEIFIFEPGLSVVIGPAPSALIIENLPENLSGLLSAPLSRAAAEIAPEDMPGLLRLSAELLECSAPEEIAAALLKYLKGRFGLTFMTILWPTLPPTCRLISLLSSHDDKRLLLSQAAFDRVTKKLETLLLPSSISELTFQNRQRQVTRLDHPALAGPLLADYKSAGLMYIENHDRDFSERDMTAFAAMLLTVSPAVADLAGTRTRRGLRKSDFTVASDIILPSTDSKAKIVFSTAAQAAAGRGSIMICGEAGTGKSTLAEYIHSVSPHKQGRLVSVNLANLPAADMELTLFGALPGGGFDRRIGLLELADGGTLYLRHVEYLPPAAQKAILVVLEEGLFAPLGAGRPRAVSLRVISSTSVDLAEKVEVGQFREDLFMRLTGISLVMPPLREIKDDIENFLHVQLNKAARDMGLNFTGVDRGALECLRAYSWPGNITELKLEAGLMAIFSRNGQISLDDLPAHLRLANEAFMGDDEEIPPFLVGETERRQLASAMSRCQGDLERVAELLGQRPESVIIKMRQQRLDPINYQGPVSLHVHKGPAQTVMPAD